MAEIEITIQLRGGLEKHFGFKSKSLNIPSNSTAGELIQFVRKILNPDKIDHFIFNEKIRPGILVLINDTDWDIEGNESAIISHKDEVTFLSTIHGG